jgi:hypothetical protein
MSYNKQFEDQLAGNEVSKKFRVTNAPTYIAPHKIHLNFGNGVSVGDPEVHRYQGTSENPRLHSPLMPRDDKFVLGSSAFNEELVQSVEQFSTTPAQESPYLGSSHRVIQLVEDTSVGRSDGTVM